MERAEIEEKINQIVDKIIQQYQPEKIILFGSWAWGESGSDSDVDLLIVKRSEKSRIDRQRELQSLLYPREIPVDVLVYTPEEVDKSIHGNKNLFIEDIIRNGKTLYTKPDSMFTVTLPQRPLNILH